VYVSIIILAPLRGKKAQVHTLTCCLWSTHRTTIKLCTCAVEKYKLLMVIRATPKATKPVGLTEESRLHDR
jgi:hypothetical protein